uniref:NAC domain-containing protein n=1 Tax=Setaria viridis TaxID=4556 RepID=A0A4U6WB60_SETVI|nr:hypothetical protein SEVIR_1G165700v2 [Setaria viridis]
MAATGLPPGILFAPEDEVAVEHYLLPRLLGWPLPADGLILDDDPLSAPPQELLERNGRKEEAFFFAEGQPRCGKGTQQKRTCAGGGWWEGQKTCAEGDKLRVPGGGEAAWRKKALNFHCGGGGKKGSTGWVMHEYAVTAPEDLARSPLRLCHIRLSSYGRKQSGAMEDCDAVAHYLLPRVLRQPLPLDGLILDDDPLSAPPWELLERNGRKEDAFFFALGQAKSGKGSRQRRTCAGGGFWNGERTCVDGEELRAPGLAGGAWRKKAFSFQDGCEKGSTGWVMHEYAITAPDHLAASQLRLYRLRFSGHGRKRKREEADNEAAPTTARRRVAEDALLDMPSLHPICSSVALADQANVNYVNGAEHHAAAAAEVNCINVNGAQHYAAPVTVSAGHDLTTGGIDTSWDFSILENFDELDELMSSIGDGGDLPSANPGVLPAVMSPGACVDADAAVSGLFYQAAAYPGVGTGLVAPSAPGMYRGCMEPPGSFFSPVPHHFYAAC